MTVSIRAGTALDSLPSRRRTTNRKTAYLRGKYGDGGNAPQARQRVSEHQRTAQRERREREARERQLQREHTARVLRDLVGSLDEVSGRSVVRRPMLPKLIPPPEPERSPS